MLRHPAGLSQVNAYTMLSYESMNDQQLISLLREGSTAAYTEIYNRFFCMLYTGAHRRLKDGDVAKDVIHDLFSTLWHKREQIFIKGSVRGYLYMSVRNRVLDILARRQVEWHYAESFQQLTDRCASVTDHLVHERELTLLIEGAITGFPAKMRKVFEMSRKDQYTHREIAQKLNISEHTVRAHIRNSLRILRRKCTLL